MRNVSLILTKLILVAAIISIAPPKADAATRIITDVLTKKEKISIRSNRCNLTIKSTAAGKVDVRCGSRLSKGSTPRTTRSTIYLEPLARAIIRRKSCFLSSNQVNLKRVNIVCLATALTPTPTKTATPTSTPTSTPTATPTVTPNANLLLSENKILSFNTSFPAGAATPVSVSGVTTGESLVSIDRRPQNGMLYALGYNSSTNSVQLYLLNSETGVATAIGTAGSFVDALGDPAPIGTDATTRFGIDFNPAADRVRIVNTTGQNFRINPNTGALVDGNLNSGTPAGVNMDAAINGGGVTFVEETAYTNNSPNQSVTTQYTLESTGDSLYIQSPPNAGQQTSALPLSSAIIAVRGFDIVAGVNASVSNSPVTSGSGFAILELASNSQQRFCSVELTTGVIASSVEIPTVTGDILGLAIQGSNEVAMIGLTSNGSNLVRFNKSAPGTMTIVGVSGVDGSETLVGLDFRPSTGQLYSLGVNATSDTATLYLIDPQTAVATAVGSTGSVAFVDSNASTIDFPAASTGYGFNFNPNVDRIRVVTASGLNFRINPVTGAAVDSNPGVTGVNPDGNISGATTAVHSASYTNSFGGTPVTTLYTIDSNSDSLYIQNPANEGSQTLQKAITLNGTSVNFSSVLAFEIPSETRTATSGSAVTSGLGYVALTIGSSTELYSIDLVSGALTSLGAISPLSGLAVAQTAIN